MAVFRVIKDKDNPYVMLNKKFIYDARLSLKAKGLMAYFLSRPDNWEFYREEILLHCTDKRDSFASALKELLEKGYIERTFKRGERGHLCGYDYSVYETPSRISTCTESTDGGKSVAGSSPVEDLPATENPATVKQPLLNKDSSLNKEGLLNKDSCCSKEAQEVIEYYCSKAEITEMNLKPNEITTIYKLIEDNVPINTIEKGIELAFKKYKPNFPGDKIKSFKYCDPVIRGLWARSLAKEKGEKTNGAVKQGNAKQATKSKDREGIGIEL